MKMRKNFRCLIAISVLIAVASLLGCQRKNPAAMEMQEDYYTCGMHPSVKLHDAKAKCPLCGMDLVAMSPKTGLVRSGDPLTEGDGIAAPGRLHQTFVVPADRQQQIGVTYTTVECKRLAHVIRAAGMVVCDRTRYWEFVARVEGYVQKLHVTSPGEALEEGQPLLTIYSPELSAAEREFVNLLDARDRASSQDGRTSTERAIEAAHHRLEARKITPDQIAELEKSRKTPEFLTLHSPFRGVVQDVAVEQGRRMMLGDRLLTVADLSVVWVWADFYEDEIPMITKGQQVRVTTKAYPGQTFEGELSLISPFLDESKHTARARIDIANADYRLRPGMYVTVELVTDLGEGLSIPASAVLPTGSRSVVFVSHSGESLERRSVELGMRCDAGYKVRSGLNPGERVLTSANFLIDAESQLQGVVRADEQEMVKAEPVRSVSDPW